MRDVNEMVTYLRDGEGRLGLDIGSRSTKMFFLSGDTEKYLICDTPMFLRSIKDARVNTDLDIVTTGYGRHRIEDARSIPEIRAHTNGILRSIEIDRCTILDIGGQDFKIIRVENRGIRDFIMNDKCAAGTGRFLEKMAEMLSVDLDELGEHQGTRKILESTCSVFTETEIISLMMEGVPVDELASGVIHSVYERVRPYLKMFPIDTVVFTGGVSKMEGLVRTISEDLGIEVKVPERSQFMGAKGCFHSRKPAVCKD